uniref:Major ampullate spidroin 1 short n=1 Tax=Cyrtophora moluccensis TaxID=299645 RepID=S5CTA9_9ARAC|nr:major ampullate spidroin 1 short [Cyrtophora moluccensis]
MTWTTRLALSFLVVICSQSLFALCQSPWQSASMAESFMTYFSEALGQSGAFTKEQIDDIDTIASSIKLGVDKMERSGKTSGSKLQAMNIAFASAVAEIATTEGGEQTAEVKTKAVADALAFAFFQTKGAVNINFINEIKNLISMFAQTNTISSSLDSAGASAAQTVRINGYGQIEAEAAAAAAAGSGVARRGGYGQDETGARNSAAIATAAAAAGAGGAGRIGYGQRGAGTGDSPAATVATVAGVGGAGRGGYDQGRSGATVAAATAGRGGYYQGGAGLGDAAAATGAGRAERGGYGEGGAAAGNAATAAAGEQGGYGGQGLSGSYGGQQGAAALASAAATRLSSPNAASRISNSVSYLLSNGGPSSSIALSNTINNAVSQISASNPGLSTCDILVQALLELISALIYILRSATIGQVNSSLAGQSASMVGQSVYRAFF